MVGRKTALKIRKAHRYLGLFIGIQFLMWTISGLYFSWTDIDDIHGDQFKKEKPKQTSFNNLLGTAQLNLERPIQNLELFLHLVLGIVLVLVCFEFQKLK